MFGRKMIGMVCCVLFAAASARALPAGYQQDNLPLPRSESGVFLVDMNGLVFYGHSESTRHVTLPGAGRETKGASNEIWTYDPVSHTHTLFYQSPAVNNGDTGINSATAVAIDTTTSPWTYYIADQEPVKGSAATTGAIWIGYEQAGLEDGDLNDATDTVQLFTAQDAFPNIQGLILNESTGEIYITNADGTAGNPMVYRMADLDASGFIESVEIIPYFLLSTNYVFAGNLCFDRSDSDVIFTMDSSGAVTRLEDINNDGDCIGDAAGETVLYAQLPINGGFDIDMDPEGELFVTASDYALSAHKLYEISTDIPPVVTEFDDLSSFAGWCGSMAFDNGTSFDPGVSGAILYMNYTTPSWSDPSEFVLYSGKEPEVPAMGLWGGSVLAILLGLAIRKRRA